MVNSTGRMGPPQPPRRPRERPPRVAPHRVERPLGCTRMARETTTRLQLRWRDLDQLGHVNQSVYHELLEEGRGALFAPLIEALGGFHFVLARVELDYRHEVRLADREVEVLSRVARIGRSSVVLEQEIRLPDGTLAAGGTSVMVAWDGGARGSRALTEAERESLSGCRGAIARSCGSRGSAGRPA